MTYEHLILSLLCGFFAGWLANTLTKARHSFQLNIFVAISGAVLANFFMASTGLMEHRFFNMLIVSFVGALIILTIFHGIRWLERSRYHNGPKP